MNIKQAKEELRRTILAYTAKNEYGNYKVPMIRQRPVLLMGPPGIGKTAIMEQITKECDIALVSYTITHHTRQSAIGLPFIEKKNFGGRDYSITEYTMSEIIASVYDRMETTGKKEGILFIDEINCVSETLAPTMLQFLQCKTFGNHKVPEGWIIVAAGNPPEYNKSVRDFDIVTLDRVKKIDVREDYEVWKEYAYERSIHPAILSYLEIRKEDFYVMESSIEGRQFVTARGWEDLSQMMTMYDELGFKVTEDEVIQYLQHERVAKDFANYLDLYDKYKKIYNVDDILEGKILGSAIDTLKSAEFDEKISMVSMLITRIAADMRKAMEEDQFTNDMFKNLKEVQQAQSVDTVVGRRQAEYDTKKKMELLDEAEENALGRLIHTLESYVPVYAEGGFDAVKAEFGNQVALRKTMLTNASTELEHVFAFLEAAFDEGQELVWFVTELTANYHTARFISRFGSDKYFYYNKELLLVEKDRELQSEIDEVRDLLKYL